MSIRFRPGLRLVTAFFTASFLLLALPVWLFAFTAIDNAPANWGDFQPPSTVWQNAHTLQASVIVTDSDGLTSKAAYQYSEDGISWSGWITDHLQIGGVVSTTRHLTVTALALGEGANYIQYVITDALGSVETSPQATINIDTLPPAAPNDLQLNPTGWQTATDVSWTATWRNPGDLSGIAAACYKIGAAPTDSGDGQCVSGDDIQRIGDIIPPAEGGFDFHLWLQDAAGNSSIANSGVITDGVQWDKTPPSLFMDIFGVIGENNWYTNTIYVSIVASDSQSSVDEVRYNLDNRGWVTGSALNIDEDGVHSLIARAEDVAGNSSETQPRELKLDKLAPTTTRTIDGAPDAQGWYESPVTITLQAHDATSDVASTQWRVDDGPWQQRDEAVLDADGKHIFRFYSRDNAGNNEVVHEEAIWIDQFPPVTSYAVLSPEEPVNGWYRQPVTVTLVPADDGIGVDKTYYRINDGAWQTGETFLLTDSDDYDIDFYSVDLLGRAEPVASIPDGVHIDTIPPRSPRPLEVRPGVWTNVNDFDLLFALPTDLSGIAGAYVKVGEPPLSPTNGQWRPDANSTLSHVQVPGEGEHKAYVWLQDNAGNVDHGNYGVWEDALSLKYDATPPTTQLAVQGDVGKNGWYTSPITITFLPTDTLSGPSTTWVSVDGGQEITATVLYLDQQDKHTVHYHSLDQAGNQEAARLSTLRIDYEAPGSPANVMAEPNGWTLTNAFTLTWSNPQDVSGIGAAYYTIGAPPAGPQDGIRIPPDGVAPGVSAPGEGAWDVYLWLEDGAGNVDIASQVVRKNALHYDVTPPYSVFTIVDGDQGTDGWYVTPVKALVSPGDDGSGPAGVRYRLNDGEWLYAEHEALIEVTSTGQFDLAYQAVDIAGNREPIQHAFFKVDVDAPAPEFLPISRYQRQTNFLVSWHGNDQVDGSGLSGFDLQSKDGRNGAWVAWVANTTDASRRYYGNYGHRYFFRIRARDRAGNLSDWVEMPWGVYIDRLQDGDFASGDFGFWAHGGALAQSVIAAPGPYDDAPVNVAQLGTPDYGPNNDFSTPGVVPVGSAAITQTIRIPGPSVMERPMLTFWYRIRTYDTEYSDRFQKIYDTLDVRLNFGNVHQLVFRDGQPYDQWLENEGKALADMGWRQAFIPIPRNMIDETVAISIQNWNRNDNWLNTWSQVTDIRVWEPYQLFLPSLTGGGMTAAALNQDEMQVLRNQQSSSTVKSR